MKYCNTCGCGLVVPDTWLVSSKKTNQYKCRACKNEYLRNWRKENPGAYKEWKYGITQEGYEALLSNQGNVCAICGTDTPGGMHDTWHIDHDHTAGKVRGLLCWLCNSGLGKFKDSARQLRKAACYLESFSES